MPQSYSTDIVIFGGGVAGLWLLNRLSAEGYHAILLEKDQLGGGQTIQSQGIIHGGLKYALHGSFSGASRAIADMPGRWRDCIEGRGEIDLSACRVLSPHFLLWSGGGIAAGLKAFLGGKAVVGNTRPAATNEIPRLLRGRGAVYQLPDFVLDAQSLIESLAAPVRHRIHSLAGFAASAGSARRGALVPASLEATAGPHSAKSPPSPRPDCDDCHADAPGRVEFIRNDSRRKLLLHTADGPLSIQARRYLFCAGEGNEGLLAAAGLPQVRCQRRPLKMVAASGAALPSLFIHVLGEGLRAKPRLTITSHQGANGEAVWYLGGELAEDGVKRTHSEQIAAAKVLLAGLFPALPLADLRWRCLDINRAEPASGGERPDNAAIRVEQDTITAWPTKLALAPALADLVMESLRGVAASGETNTAAAGLPGPPPLARPIWS